ncbi:MAG: hypothetical protein KAS32_04225 [Candidatus Peribacteraceae bacterium]|nr:hypothetical protein [Candidatus Peribacteraceae bacterium]
MTDKEKIDKLVEALKEALKTISTVDSFNEFGDYTYPAKIIDELGGNLTEALAEAGEE